MRCRFPSRGIVFFFGCRGPEIGVAGVFSSMSSMMNLGGERMMMDALIHVLKMGSRRRFLEHACAVRA
jgi:hypothetical protein